MTIDNHMRIALDRALAAVRAPLESALPALAKQVAVEVRVAELNASATPLSDALSGSIA